LIKRFWKDALRAYSAATPAAIRNVNVQKKKSDLRLGLTESECSTFSAFDIPHSVFDSPAYGHSLDLGEL